MKLKISFDDLMILIDSLEAYETKEGSLERYRKVRILPRLQEIRDAYFEEQEKTEL